MLKKDNLLILILCLLLTVLNIIPTSLVKAANNSYDESISLNSQEIKQGKVLTIKMESNRQIKKITFNQVEYKLNKDKNSNIFTAIIPISYWLQPGDYKLHITGANNNINKNIKVLPGNFKESYITVDSNQEEIIRPQNKETIERKNKDSQLVKEARKISSTIKLWQNKFIWPIEGTITTPFAATRYVNKKLNNRHSGIDIAAPQGTPIKATANGIVKLSTELLVTGNTIIIDHGWNVSSSYSHLDKIHVSVGQEVNEGDIIGSIGSTGFSTGPHLHWAVKVNGVFVNPEQFIEEEI